jgi:hypothetical protein
MGTVKVQGTTAEEDAAFALSYGEVAYIFADLSVASSQ